MTDEPVTFAEVPLAGYMDAEPTPQRYAFLPILPRRVVTLLGGHGGAGKSFVALTLLAHGACGLPFAGFEPEGVVRGLYVTLEDEADRVRTRLRDITVTFGLDATLIAANLRILDGTANGMPLVHERNDFGTRSLEASYLLGDLAAAASDTDLVMIDNASDAFEGDENSRRQVRAFIQILTTIARDTDASVVLLAHIDKLAARNGTKGQTYSGSTAWHNGVRSRIALFDREESIELTHEKSNFTGKAAPVTLRRNDRGVPIPLAAKDCAEEHQRDADAAMALMRAAAMSGIAVVCATTGPSTTWHVLRHLPEAAPFEADRRRLFTALEELSRQKRIVKSVIRTPQRKLRDVWALTEAATAMAHLHDNPGTDHSTEGARADPPIPPDGALARASDARADAQTDGEEPSARIGALARAASNGSCTAFTADEYLRGKEENL